MFQPNTYQQPSGSEGAFAQTTGWLADLLLGSVGTTIAVLALAGVGLAMLNGRISTRGGIRAILGCFILFGASSIANSLIGLARTSATIPEIPPPMLPAVPVIKPVPTVSPDMTGTRANPFDPYAGASGTTR